MCYHVEGELLKVGPFDNKLVSSNSDFIIDILHTYAYFSFPILFLYLHFG